MSAVGIYGAISHVVAQRRHEIGIRMALGARTMAVGQLILRQSLTLSTIGATIGVAIALATTRL